MEMFMDRVWFITGTSSGFGREIATAALGAGDRVVATARQVSGLADLVERAPDHVRAVALDVTDPAAVCHAVDVAVAEFGPIDVLVNNAGGDRFAFFVDTDEASWDAVLDVNLKGAMACTHAVLSGMFERKRGVIVNVASEAGRVGTVAGAAYSAAKAGVIGFTKAIAREGANLGVRCNAVAPGPIETPLLNGSADSGRLGARMKQGMIDATILGRSGSPEEVAGSIAFLASDDASYITGHTLAVSGGLAMV
jgi:2-hydroxycyclohexanecarboxyl-CoA dehydrogenase